MYLFLPFRADAARQKSEALRNLATQLIEEHKDYTKKNELDAEYRLEERNKDVGFWKQELEEEVEAMKREVELLTESRRNMDHAAAQTERPLRIFTKCRENRERRIGIDRVKDSVEKRLQEENETILHYQQLMREIVNQVILSLRSIRYEILLQFW